MTFRFCPYENFRQNFDRIEQPRGLLLCHPHRDVSNILKIEKFPFVWILLKLTEGVKFGSIRTILDIKTQSLKVKSIFQG